MQTRDILLKRALQYNFTRPIHDFPAFPKELLPFPKAGCAKRELVEVPSKKEKFATKEDKAKKGKTSKEELEKRKSLTIESGEAAQKETTPTVEASEKGKEAVQPKLVEDMSAQDWEIDHLINEITETDKEEESTSSIT